MLFFKIFPDIILCEKKTDQLAYSGIFSVTDLNDFYVTKQSAEDNLKKMCFCEGIGAVFALLSDIEWIQLNKIISLRPIIGKECYENFLHFYIIMMMDQSDFTLMYMFLLPVYFLFFSIFFN